MPNLSIHKPSRLWSRNTTQLEDTPSKSRQDRVGLIGLFTNEHKSRKRSSDDDNEEEEPKRKKQRKESVTRFLKKCIPKKKSPTKAKATTKQEPPCEIDVTNPFKLPVIEWTGGCIYLCLSDMDFDKKEQEYEDIMHFPKPPNWRASVPQANQNKRRQRKESCPSRFFNPLIEESSDDESDMPRTPTSDHETLLLSKIENLNILS
jgi:hypothetical protein